MTIDVSPDAAFAVLSNTETVLRLSPYWSLTELQPCSGPTNGPARSYRAALRYDGRDGAEAQTMTVSCTKPDRKIRWILDTGLLKELEFTIQEQDGGVRVTQRLLLASDDEEFLQGTADELARWLRRIVKYLPVAASGAPLSRLLRWCLDRVWLRLTLSERRIAVIMIAVSAVELVFLVVMVAVWNQFFTGSR